MQKIFNERYEIIEKIGTGGMADVYKATDNVLERTVAIKVLHPQYASDDSFIGRFRREAKAAANLNHPNIVNIYDWGQQDDNYYIVMEYLKGKNLKEILADKDKLNWKDTARIGSEVASALTFAHRNEVVHRDIKPHNIIITDSKDVKVTDFGIARAGASTMTQTGTILGTAHYISPEQAQGLPADSRSDLYSLGIVLYETVTGKMPFDGENPIGIAMKHVSENIPELTLEDAPESFQNIIRKALAKDPDERYQTAEELREDLNSVLSGGQISASLPSEDKTVILSPMQSLPKQQPPAKKRKKKKKWPYAVAFMTIALIALAVFAYNMINTPGILIPDVTGMKSDNAAKLLKERKLVMRITEKQYSDDIGSGRIIEQDPAAGAKVSEGDIVEVIVSKGIEKIEIPDLDGQTRTEAEETLSDAGLSLGTVKYQESSQPSGIVISQDPSPGETVEKDTSVNLIVTKEIAKVSVPNVIGRSKRNSEIILGNAGLNVSFVKQFSDTVEEGLVIDQSPSPAEDVKRGTTVIVYVSKGPKIQKVEVPDVIGTDKNTATDQIEAAGLSVTYSGTGNTVENQAPASGTMVDEGSTVTLTLVP